MNPFQKISWIAPRPPRVVAITVVRNEEDIVEAFVRHTASMVDHHLIVDHCSYDDTVPILQKLRAEGLSLSLLRSSDPIYNQPPVTNVLLQMALEDQAADWVIPLDADEFILPPDEHQKLAEAISAAPKNEGVLCYPFRTYHPMPTDDSNDPNPVTRIRHHYIEETGEYHKILVHRKTASQPGAWIMPGNHHFHANGIEILPVRLPGFELGHFPVRSLGQFIRKITTAEIGKDAFGKKRKGLGTQKTAPFEQLKADPIGFFHHALDPERPLRRRPADYRGGSLRFTKTGEGVAETVRAVLTLTHDIARHLGRHLDQTRDQSVNPLVDKSSVKLKPIPGIDATHPRTSVRELSDEASRQPDKGVEILYS